ncbi:Elongator complex protein 3 [Aduncisulcus paluster]|uniref:Elongator complex protein 3 n=1 Tax=Aduncisulcus paluster TaxID=2918883 RepID=A0ABQ5KT50_9EUKA|nr:Elongator complex protein 3 [Aduncisulcus paluster]
MASTRVEVVQEIGDKYINHYLIHGDLNPKDLDRIRSSVCQERRFKSTPTYYEILNSLSEDFKGILRPFLKRKPVRTASGVAIVAVMCKPHRCPHQATTGSACIYCPGGPDSDFEYSSQSYTGFEPTSMRAIRARYDPYSQVRVRLDQIADLGHPVDKVELILMGGTFMALGQKYRDKFISKMHDALSGASSSSIYESIIHAEHAKSRCVGLTIETRPDYCLPKHIADMLLYGATRVEVGVQTVYRDVMRAINRGHTIRSVSRCFADLKDSGYKVTAHMMPNLIKTDFMRDLWGFQDLFESLSFRPDGLKLYPTLVIRGTNLYNLWKFGKYRSYTQDTMLDLLTKLFLVCPPWVRVYRVQRDIPDPLVTSGAGRGNLRDLILRRILELGGRTGEIRAREVGLAPLNATRAKEVQKKKRERTITTAGGVVTSEAVFTRRDYCANGSWESFLSFEDAVSGALIGLLRLRLIRRSFRPELRGRVSMIREVHVYGSASKVGTAGVQQQHRGYGRLLIKKAEEIAKNEHRSRKIVVIAGLGTKFYYGKNGFKHDGVYMSKML